MAKNGLLCYTLTTPCTHAVAGTSPKDPKKGGPAMPYYIILSNLTDEGRRTIKQRPERIVEVNKEIEAMGVKVHKQYALLGMYDFVNIVEAPDNETVMKMSVELGSRGSVQMTTLPALSVEEFIRKIK
jgi:uncharacterized protein with GYD domain